MQAKNTYICNCICDICALIQRPLITKKRKSFLGCLSSLAAVKKRLLSESYSFSICCALLASHVHTTQLPDLITMSACFPLKAAERWQDEDEVASALICSYGCTKPWMNVTGLLPLKAKIKQINSICEINVQKDFRNVNPDLALWH